MSKFLFAVYEKKTKQIDEFCFTEHDATVLCSCPWGDFDFVAINLETFLETIETLGLKFPTDNLY